MRFVILSFILILSACSSDKKPLFDDSEVQTFFQLDQAESEVIEKDIEIAEAQKAPETKKDSTVKLASSDKEQAPEVPKKTSYSGKISKEFVRFEAVWAGVNVGDLVGSIYDDGKGECHVQVLIRARGLAYTVSKYKSHFLSKIKCDEDRIEPYQFRRMTQKRNRKRDSRVEYIGLNLGVSKVSIEPPEPEWKREDVPKAQLIGVYDPLSVLLQIRRDIKEAVDAGHRRTKPFIYKLYDGRRLTQLEVNLIGLTTSDQIHITAKYKPLAGYNDREISDVEERNILITFYLDKETLMPEHGKGFSSFGTAKAKRKESCDNWRDCLD